MVAAKLVAATFVLACATLVFLQAALSPCGEAGGLLGGRGGGRGAGSRDLWASSAEIATAAAVAAAPAAAATEAAKRAVCARFEPLGLYRQAEVDFGRYSGGLTPEQEAEYASFCERRARAACFTIVVLGGRISVKNFYPGYQSRHRSTLHAIYRVALRFGPLPDALLVVEVTDGSFSRVDLPIFMITRPRDLQLGILYPDFTFNTWPEAVCPPERSHAYGFLHEAFRREAAEASRAPEEAWRSKQDVLFWRGGVVANAQRSRAVEVLSGEPGTDVRFIEWRNVSITGKNGAPGCVGLLEHCRYRYLAFLDGNTYSSRLKYQLLCGSCVFASRQPWAEWWSHLFEPGRDYVEVRPDWSDAAQRLAEVRASPDAGRGVAERGRAKALGLLSEDAVDCYWRRLLEMASRVLPKPPASLAGTAARPVEDVLLYPNNAAIDATQVYGPVEIVR